MKIERDGQPAIVIGKRITLGAAINSIAAIAAHFDPDNAVAYVAVAVPITFIAQMIVANWIGITTAEGE